jgi:general secretion pathway protein D
MPKFIQFLSFWLVIAAMGVYAQDAPPAAPAEAIPTAAPVVPVDAASQPRLMRGTDQVLAPANTKGAVEGAPTGLRFEDAPLGDVVGVILREIAKVDYVVHPPLNGSVTLSTQGDVSADQAMFLLEAALQANGLQMARDARGTYHIGRPEAIKGIVPALRQATSGSPLPAGYGAVVVPLKYIGAAEMAAILRPMAPPEALVRVDTVRNLLVLVGTRTQAEGWLDIVSTFDVDLLKGMSVGVFPLKHVSTQEIEAALRLLTSGAGGSAGAAPASASAASTSRVPDAAAGAVLPASFPLFGALRVLPIARINSVMVVTPRAAYLDEARRWIDKLDQPGGNSAEAQLFTYAVQNGNAKHLANVLNGLFGGGAQAPAQPASTGVAPGVQATTAATTGFSATNLSAAGSAGGAAGARISGGTVQGTGLTSVTLGSGVRVMADEINNVVLVLGTKAEYEKIEATLKRLDVAPTQVLIEASIIEVTLNDELKYGLQWAFNDPARGGLTGMGVLSTAAGAVLGSTPAGFSYTVSNSAGDVRGVLTALADKSLVKVISSPSLMVLDNHTASIAVGNQQPVKVGDTTSSGGNVTTNIQYKDTGVSLGVTPSVNAGNMVTMQLTQTVTDVGSVDTATGQRSFLQRQFASKVAVRSGESLVLGGLIRDNTANGKSGLPGLQDIPLLGYLFGAKTTSVNRTELLVIITPRVVRTEFDVRQVGQDLKDRMKSLYPSEP